MSETGSSNDDAPSTRDGQSSRSETGKITHRLLHCCNTSESISNDSCSAMSSSLVFRHSQAQDVFLKTGPVHNRLSGAIWASWLGSLLQKLASIGLLLNDPSGSSWNSCAARDRTRLNP